MGGFGRGERAWVRGAQAGSVSDLEALFRAALAPGLPGRATSSCHDAAAAEDIAQESFLAALRSLDRFDRRRPFGPWLHRIAVNRAIDWARARALRARGRAASDGARPRRRPAAGPTPCPTSVSSALRGLSPEHRAVIVLRYVLEYTPGEIAGLLDLPARNGQLTPAPRARRAAGPACPRPRCEGRAPPPPAALRSGAGGGRGAAARLAGRQGGVRVARQPVRWPRRHARQLLVLAALAAAFAVASAVVTAPGRALVDSLRDAIGRERVRGIRHAQPALFRLPASGRVLVNSTKGAWILRSNGSKRLLGAYADAAWSPHGLFVVAVRGHELVALTPRGAIRWTVARRGRPRLPSWSPSGRVAGDTRIACRRARPSGWWVGTAGATASWPPTSRRCARRGGPGPAMSSRTCVARGRSSSWTPTRARCCSRAGSTGYQANSRGRTTERGSQFAHARPCGSTTPAASSSRRAAVGSLASSSPSPSLPGATAWSRRACAARRRPWRSRPAAAPCSRAPAGSRTSPGRRAAAGSCSAGVARPWVLLPAAGGKVRAFGNVGAQFRSRPSGPFPDVAQSGWCC